MIFEELKGRVKLADQSTYTQKDNYYYYWRTEEDKDYIIYCSAVILRNQGWEFAHSCICSSLFCTKSIILKSESLSPLFTKERCE